MYDYILNTKVRYCIKELFLLYSLFTVTVKVINFQIYVLFSRLNAECDGAKLLLKIPSCDFRLSSALARAASFASKEWERASKVGRWLTIVRLYELHNYCISVAHSLLLLIHGCVPWLGNPDLGRYSPRALFCMRLRCHLELLRLHI